MRRILTICACLAVLSALALAESWNGKLIDVSCYEQQKSATTCDATGATTAFGVVVSEQVFKLDAAGNAKAAEALKSRADRSSDPAKPQSKGVMAIVSGTKDGDNTIKVEKIEVQ